MHEFGLARSIVQRAVQEAESHQSERVEALRIIVGAEHFLDQEALSMSIQAAAQGTPAEGAEVRFTTGPGKNIVLAAISLSGE